MDSRPRTRSIKSRKACTACANAKRQCDKGIPACKRCREMEICCQYPSGRPYGCRTKPAADVAEPSQHAPRVEEETSVEASDDPQITQEDEQYKPFVPLDADIAGASATPLTTSSWFLHADSWTIMHAEAVGREENCSSRMSDIKEFIATIRNWLSQWARDAHCPLLHRHLYSETGLPQCLEDAFAAVAMYESKTDANEYVVMGIIEKNTKKLLDKVLASSNPAMEGSADVQTTELLARVQALFIYQFLGLFGSDIRQRARAEATIPTMMRINSMMWDSTNADAYLETSLGLVGFFSQSLRLGGGGGASDACSQQWRDWLLAESVRRIWLMVNYTHAVYTMMRDGLGSCPGGVAFTAREGLWDAQSPWPWRRIVRKHDPLFVQCHAASQIMSSVPIKETDSFCQSLVGLMWGAPQLDLWRAKGEIC